MNDEELTDELQFNAGVNAAQREYFGSISFIPIRKIGNGKYERVQRITLEVQFTHKKWLLHVVDLQISRH